MTTELAPLVLSVTLDKAEMTGAPNPPACKMAELCLAVLIWNDVDDPNPGRVLLQVASTPTAEVAVHVAGMALQVRVNALQKEIHESLVNVENTKSSCGEPRQVPFKWTACPPAVLI